MLSYETILQRVQERTGLADQDQARAVLDATLGALGTCLARAEALALADQLPEPLGDMLRNARFTSACDDEDTLYQRVSEREGVGAGLAREHVQAVCQLLGEDIDSEIRQRLERALPAPLADLLAPPPTPSPERPERPVVPPGYGHTHETPHAPAGTGHTLAEARPGSRHPMSEANPDLGQPDSVAGTDDPYPDRKLSTGHARPRSGHTLAEGQPGSDHPVSESD